MAKEKAKKTQGHVLLRDFMRRHDLDAVKMAAMSGLTDMQIRHLSFGRRGPSLMVAVAIEQATAGVISASSWTQEVKR
jgi:plasmid maintenance system antidote protein VapI